MVSEDLELVNIALQEYQYVDKGKYRIGVEGVHFDSVNEHANIFGTVYIAERVKVRKGFFKKREVEKLKTVLSVDNIFISRNTLDDFVTSVKGAVIRKYSKKISNGLLSEALKPIYEEYMRVHKIACGAS